MGQRGVEDCVHPTHCRLGHTSGPPARVEVADVDRAQAVEGDVADLRRDVSVDAGQPMPQWEEFVDLADWARRLVPTWAGDDGRCCVGCPPLLSRHRRSRPRRYDPGLTVRSVVVSPRGRVEGRRQWRARQRGRDLSSGPRTQRCVQKGRVVSGQVLCQHPICAPAARCGGGVGRISFGDSHARLYERDRRLPGHEQRGR